MKKQQKTPLQNRFKNWVIAAPGNFFLWLFSAPVEFILGVLNAFSPTKTPPEEIEAFRKLTPDQRWEKVKKPSWTDEQLAKERMFNYWLSCLFLLCGLVILLCTILAHRYLNLFQILGALAYAAAAFLMFAKKSMRVYALDNRKIILFDEWLRLPNYWLT